MGKGFQLISDKQSKVVMVKKGYATQENMQSNHPKSSDSYIVRIEVGLQLCSLLVNQFLGGMISCISCVCRQIKVIFEIC